ncbi:hypothetical protein FOXYS1_5479 [Fusarium oxysporum]|uniref:NADP-dependent oxidoreductase domain-containing protein n=1 Tax=Fusarium oxysporum TaxID=5507 RepID=A0A8H5AGR8_FUSOX|nr:hypothetical protein FOXYS1_5479 [Fusarium oxysporum]
MMTDSVIANLPPDGLRVIIRSLLASHPEITTSFEDATRLYLAQAQTKSSKSQFTTLDIDGLEKSQKIARCMLGSGQAFDGVSILDKLVVRGIQIALDSPETEKQRVDSLLASMDGDLVQAMTAVTKRLAVSSGARVFSSIEQNIVQRLLESLAQCQEMLKGTGIAFPYGRGMLTTANILGVALPDSPETRLSKVPSDIARPPPAKETFQLDDRTLPRIFSGLWQMSSPAWGSAQMSKIIEGFSTHVQNGFTAFDMADHYGDAEVLYVQHLERVVESGIKIYTNQVQFSLIDSRPTVRMADACSTHDIKLLTYGTLCGGFIADKWLNQPEPVVYDTNITPSQRKYYGMICSWGGWGLFQELLSVLRTIATKHKVNISNIATRWVLDFSYVGAVIIGARIGMSEHTSDNATTLGWGLDDDDRMVIEEVLNRSNRAEMFEAMGDCGNEYR